MSIDIRNLRNEADKARKENELLASLRRQAKLAEDYNQALVEQATNQKLNITPVAPQTRSVQEMKEDAVFQRQTFFNNMKTIMDPAQAQKLMIDLTDNDIYLTNSNFKDILTELKGKTNLDANFFRRFLARYATKLTRTGDTGIEFPASAEDIDALRKDSTKLLGEISDSTLITSTLMTAMDRLAKETKAKETLDELSKKTYKKDDLKARLKDFYIKTVLLPEIIAEEKAKEDDGEEFMDGEEIRKAILRRVNPSTAQGDTQVKTYYQAQFGDITFNKAGLTELLERLGLSGEEIPIDITTLQPKEQEVFARETAKRIGIKPDVLQSIREGQIVGREQKVSEALARIADEITDLRGDRTYVDNIARIGIFEANIERFQQEIDVLTGDRTATQQRIDADVIRRDALRTEATAVIQPLIDRRDALEAQGRAISDEAAAREAEIRARTGGKANKKLRQRELQELRLLYEPQLQAIRDAIVEVRRENDDARRYYIDQLDPIDAQIDDGNRDIAAIEREQNNTRDDIRDTGEAIQRLSDEIQDIVSEIQRLEEQELATEQARLSQFDRRFNRPPRRGEEAKIPPNPRTGRGMQSYGNTKIMRPHGRRLVGKGISSDEQQRYKEFGKYLIHMPSLKKGILNLKFPSFASIPTLKQTALSRDLLDLITDLLENKQINKRLYSRMSKEDQDFIYTIAQKAEIDETLGMGIRVNETQRDDMERFQLVRGQVMAGNNNPEILRELKQYIMKFMRDGTMNKHQGSDLLFEISCLG